MHNKCHQHPQSLFSEDLLITPAKSNIFVLTYWWTFPSAKPKEVLVCSISLITQFWITNKKTTSLIYILRIVRQGVVKKNQKCIRINDLQILEGSSELRVYANHSYAMNDYSDNFPFLI